jgi:hypothetical protein
MVHGTGTRIDLMMTKRELSHRGRSHVPTYLWAHMTYNHTYVKNASTIVYHDLKNLNISDFRKGTEEILTVLDIAYRGARNRLLTTVTETMVFSGV